jgi:hypothetical protein
MAIDSTKYYYPSLPPTVSVDEGGKGERGIVDRHPARRPRVAGGQRGKTGTGERVAQFNVNLANVKYVLRKITIIIYWSGKNAATLHCIRVAA